MDAASPVEVRLTVAPTGTLTSSERAQTVALCTRAFDKDFGALFDVVVDSTHVLARVDAMLVGHACWSTRWLQPAGCAPLRTAYVDAVATAPERQNQGIGSRVLRRLAAEIQGYELGGLSTRRVSFYERLGWERWRGPTAARSATGLVATPDATVLVLRTARTPPLDLTALLTAERRPYHPW